MKLLITGGAGFMGSNFIRYILEAYPNYEIVNLDKLTYAGNLDNLRDVENDPRYKFIKGDICNQKLMEEISKGVEAIINFAAETHVDRSILSSREFVITDVVGTQTLLEVVRKNKIPKMIQISTDEVYGSIKEGAFTEESTLLPNSPYAASKAGADLLCRAYFETYKTPVIVVRSVNFYGPYQYPEKIIPLFVTNLLEGKKVPLYGRGLNVRTWIYTEDYCRILDLILHKGRVGEIYNVGTNDETPNIDLARIILRYLDEDDSFIEYVKDRPGHDWRYFLDWSKIKKEFGWEPKMSFEEGIKKTIGWYKENEWWWRKLKATKFKEYYTAQYG